MKKKTVWIAGAFIIAVVAFVVISTFHQTRVTCRVCMTFQGRQDCRTASSVTKEEAMRAAITNACAQLASGVILSSQCENTQPDSVDWLH
ncbi:MAG TPA: hypothetical protein VG675_01410 [Bryobacteraceae bacterium]|nr:hypothetical protein [Bryobacteraceae bacterium]